MLSNKTEFNKEWKEYSLEELGQFSRGKSKHRPRDDKSLFGGKYTFIQTGDIKQANLWVNSFSKTYNEKGLEQSKLWGKDTLCITIAANIAETAILKFDACFPDSVVGFVSDKNKSNVYFMHYLFCFIKQKIQRATSGSVQDNINLEFLKKLRLNIPPLEKQEKIANILLSLDNKIELNNEMNKTLEEMAQSIFKGWFVDFEFPNEDGQPYKSSGGEMVESELGMIPKGWEVGSFSDISEILDSKRIPLSKREREKRANIYPYYGAASLMDYVDDYIFEGIHVLMGEDGTVIDKDGFPILQYVGGKFWVNNHAHVLKGKNEFSNEFVYLYLSNTNVTHLVTGAVQPKINQKNLTSLKLPIPDKNMTVKFNSLAKNIFEYIYEIRQENKKLEEIRSILLPVLMNGTINIK